MKKITLLASLCAMFIAPQLAAQEAQEVQYVEDPAQGVLINDFKSNWFITVQGGANVFFSSKDAVRDFQDRFAPAANIYVGKWFTPVWGARLGIDWISVKGMGVEGATGYLPNEHQTNGYFKTRNMHLGPSLDLMFNLTNLFCGYKPNRVYNLVGYAGGGAYFTATREHDAQGNADGWDWGGDQVLHWRAGIINSFNVSKSVALSLDLRASALDGIYDAYVGQNRTYLDVQAYLGVTFLLGNSEWKAPIVPVCPPAENCDAYRARLSAADARIADLEQQLRDCLNRPVEVKEVESNAPLATIYYPIGVSRLTREDNNVLGAIAEVMKANPNTNYVLTGWADNYTGTDAFNKQLRQKRVQGVYNRLVKNGVPESQLTATTNDGSLCGDLGEKYVSLDRAVTIEEAK